MGEGMIGAHLSESGSSCLGKVDSDGTASRVSAAGVSTTGVAATTSTRPCSLGSSMNSDRVTSVDCGGERATRDGEPGRTMIQWKYRQDVSQ